MSKRLYYSALFLIVALSLPIIVVTWTNAYRAVASLGLVCAQ